jgi:hypothetical protein
MPLSKILSGSLASGVGGKVLQVVQSVKTDTFTTSSSSLVDVTGLSVSITPSSSSNKILVLAQISYGGVTNAYAYGKLIRGSTSILQGDSDSANRNEATFSLTMTNEGNSEGSKQHMVVVNYLDSPATTSSTTYKIQIANIDSNQSSINRSSVDSNNGYEFRTTSTITAIEIAA